jgi:ribosomal protein L24
MEGPVHYSNVQLADKYDSKPNRSSVKAAKPAAKKATKKAKAAESGNEG